MHEETRISNADGGQVVNSKEYDFVANNSREAGVRPRKGTIDIASS